MQTETALIAVHKSPVVRLDEICATHLNLGAQEARRLAALNLLPVPTFKLRESKKAPYMVKVTDLATYIDQSAGQAREQWERSQL
jgi:hypothetical protein